MRIRAEKLVKQFGSGRALDSISMGIEPGQIIAVLGANGAGKTTLINALAGVIQLDSGQVFFDDELYTTNRDYLRRRFALIPDIPPVPRSWSPLRFIGTLLKLYGTSESGIEQRVEKLLGDLDLLPVARWSLSRLSRGQIYKSVLAGFIAADPEVWFVDEPFASGMDPRGLNCFKEYARESAKRGHTLVYTTQIIEVAEQFAHRVCVLEHGKIMADASPSELREKSGLHEWLTQLRETTTP